MSGGGEGRCSWILHRITGVGVLLFLLVHILDTMLIGWGPAVYNRVIALYRLPLFRIGELLLAAAVLYHALNGMRIAIIDFWEEATLYHRQLFYAEVILFALLLIPGAYFMLRPP